MVEVNSHHTHCRIHASNNNNVTGWLVVAGGWKAVCLTVGGGKGAARGQVGVSGGGVGVFHGGRLGKCAGGATHLHTTPEHQRPPTENHPCLRMVLGSRHGGVCLGAAGTQAWVSETCSKLLQTHAGMGSEGGSAHPPGQQAGSSPTKVLGSKGNWGHLKAPKSWVAGSFPQLCHPSSPSHCHVSSSAHHQTSHLLQRAGREGGREEVSPSPVRSVRVAFPGTAAHLPRLGR